MSNSGTTVIITTHYLQEAERTDCVGFMRKGRILCQGHPKTLMANLQVKSLDKVLI